MRMLYDPAKDPFSGSSRFPGGIFKSSMTSLLVLKLSKKARAFSSLILRLYRVAGCQSLCGMAPSLELRDEGGIVLKCQEIQELGRKIGAIGPLDRPELGVHHNAPE